MHTYTHNSITEPTIPSIQHLNHTMNPMKHLPCTESTLPKKLDIQEYEQGSVKLNLLLVVKSHVQVLLRLHHLTDVSPGWKSG